MSNIVKKAVLIYFLFLLSTISNYPGLASETSPEKQEPDVEFFQPDATVRNDAQQTLSETQEKAESRSEMPKVAVEESPTEPAVDFAGITPVAIEIPAIGESAEVIEVGQTEDGAMEAPASIYQIGWYARGTKPGSAGNAVMAGHVDGLTSPGTFYNLKKLEPGDKIHVTDEKGKTLTFFVREKQAYETEASPLEKIFGASTESHLNLITCTGDFNQKTGLYEERLVVYTDLVIN